MKQFKAQRTSTCSNLLDARCARHARLEALRAALRAALRVPAPHACTAHALRAGVDALVDDLRLHMCVEDDVLFPPFAAVPRTRASLV